MFERRSGRRDDDPVASREVAQDSATGTSDKIHDEVEDWLCETSVAVTLGG